AGVPAPAGDGLSSEPTAPGDLAKDDDAAARHLPDAGLLLPGLGAAPDGRVGGGLLFLPVAGAAVHVVLVLHDPAAAGAARQRRPRLADEHAHLLRAALHQLQRLPDGPGLPPAPPPLRDGAALPAARAARDFDEVPGVPRAGAGGPRLLRLAGAA